VLAINGADVSVLLFLSSNFLARPFLSLNPAVGRPDPVTCQLHFGYFVAFPLDDY